MKSAPLVSFVTPCYNTRDYLSECIESVLRQTYKDWKFILVDNCSTDRSAEIAERYAGHFPDKIRLVHTESFLSQVQNYNFALTCIPLEQIVTVLRQIEVEIANGKTTPQACKEAEITEQTYYRWRKEYGGLKLDQAKRLKELERENAKLKRLVAELSLEKQILKDVAEGNF